MNKNNPSQQERAASVAYVEGVDEGVRLAMIAIRDENLRLYRKGFLIWPFERRKKAHEAGIMHAEGIVRNLRWGPGGTWEQATAAHQKDQP